MRYTTLRRATLMLLTVTLAGCQAAPARPAAPAAAPAAQSPPAAPVAPNAATGAAPAAAPAPSTPLEVEPRVRFDIGQLPGAAFQWGSYAAQDRGFLAAQGLDLEIVQIGTPNEAARATVSNSVSISHFSVDAAVRAIEGGGDLVVIGSEIANPAFSLVVQPELTSYDQLKGKSFAVSTPKDGAAVVLRLMLRARGLGDNDYDFASVGTTPNRFAALKSKQADGAIMTQPVDFVAMDDGFRLLGRSTDVLKDFMFMSVTANRTWARENPRVVARYLRGLGAAIDWLYDPANKDDAIDLLAAHTKVERSAAARTYTVFIEEGKVLPRHAEVPVPGLEAFLQAMIELGDLPGPTPNAARYIEPSYGQLARQ
jgi:ABC-type nitrate/sulfonate/bicarbonate transport system substrate-binding protein